MNHLRLLAVLLAMTLVATAYAGPGTSPSAAAGPDAWPDTLVMGFVPSREADQLVEDIDALTEALAAALSEQAGREISR